MQSRSRRPKSTPTLGKSLESAASVEVRTLLVRRESKRTHVFHARTSPSDRKVARRCNHFVVIAARALLRARGDHPGGQTRSIRSGKLWRRQERARSFADRNKMCI